MSDEKYMQQLNDSTDTNDLLLRRAYIYKIKENNGKQICYLIRRANTAVEKIEKTRKERSIGFIRKESK